MARAPGPTPEPPAACPATVTDARCGSCTVPRTHTGDSPRIVDDGAVIDTTEKVEISGVPGVRGNR